MGDINPDLAVDLSSLNPANIATVKGIVAQFKTDTGLYELENGNPASRVPVLEIHLHELGSRKIVTSFPPDLIVPIASAMLGWLNDLHTMQQMAQEAARQNNPDAASAVMDLLKKEPKQ